MKVPWERRFILVMGKGGVGRSTVAAALGLAAARSGRKTCVAELYGQGRVASVLDLDGRAFLPRAVVPNLDTLSLTPAECLEDFARRKLKLDRFIRPLLNNRMVSSFIDAVPGLHDLLQLGKLENLLFEPLPLDPRYDVIIVDAPATGHGLTLLSAARTMTDMARMGPFHDLARVIEDLLSDPRNTAIVLVSLPEDLPVNETLELIAALEADRALLGGVVANGVRSPVIPPTPPWEDVLSVLAAATNPDVRVLAQLADPHVRQVEAQTAAIARLRAGLPVAIAPLALLPQIEGREPGRADLVHMASILSSAWGAL